MYKSMSEVEAQFRQELAQSQMGDYDNWLPANRQNYQKRFGLGPVIPTRPKNRLKQLPGWPSWTKVKVMT